MPNFRLVVEYDGAAFRGKDSVLSGPAGGVVGYARAAEADGLARAIGFDMGGTSTDVSRWDGRFEREFETEKAGVRIVAPGQVPTGTPEPNPMGGIPVQ